MEIVRYWWILAIVVGIALLIKIFGGEGGGGDDPSDPCALTGSSGCM